MGNLEQIPTNRGLIRISSTWLDMLHLFCAPEGPVPLWDCLYPKGLYFSIALSVSGLRKGHFAKKAIATIIDLRQ